MLNTAVQAARRAGRIIMQNLNRMDRVQVESKGLNDYVTQVDLAAEHEILATLRGAYPDHAFLAEESGESSGRGGSGSTAAVASGDIWDSEYLWIVDPLDGTTNFLHGYPQFAVSICLHHRGKAAQAVVFDPLRNELFTASRGSGAMLNDRRMRISQFHQMQNALLGTGFPFKSMQYLDPWIETFRILLPRTSGVRRAGSAALDLAHVACGRLDGFWEFGLNPWDMAAGALLVQEAGGMVSGLRGGEDYLRSGHVAAGNPRIHPQLLELLAPAIPAGVS